MKTSSIKLCFHILGAVLCMPAFLCFVLLFQFEADAPALLLLVMALGFTVSATYMLAGAPHFTNFSQRPPAKPEAWQRWSGPRPLGPAGDCSAPFNLPHVIGSRSRTRKSLLHRAFIRPLCFSTTNGSAQLFRDQNPWASLQLLPDFPSTHIPGTVKLWESLRQSRRISQGLKGNSRPRTVASQNSRTHDME